MDQLLAVQFREDMVRIVEHVGRKAPTGRQTILVSATLTHNVRIHPLAKLSQKWLCCHAVMHKLPTLRDVVLELL